MTSTMILALLLATPEPATPVDYQTLIIFPGPATYVDFLGQRSWYA